MAGGDAPRVSAAAINEAFLRGALKALERERYVERYAYYNPGQQSPLSLLGADGSLTELGQRYAET